MTQASLVKSEKMRGKSLLVGRLLSSSSHGSLELFGGYGSPYTRKVESALRYKRIPFIQRQLMPGNITGDWTEHGLDHIRPKVIPVVRYPCGSCHNDSTGIFKELDTRYPDRPILPGDPGQQFLSLLLEDMFDEWGTKIMFGMRWLTKEDQDWSGVWLAYDNQLGRGVHLSQVREFGRMFGSRQMGRMEVVGCTNQQLVLRSLEALAGALERHLETGSLCILGSTPSVADFALYGQLSQLVVDSSPDRLIRSQYPAVWAWLRKFEDLSGLEGAFYCGDACLKEMLRFAGSVYLPFLQANRQALASGETRLQVEIFTKDPLLHNQPAFKYQEKCFRILQERFRQLGEEEGDRIRPLLAETNCLTYLISA